MLRVTVLAASSGGVDVVPFLLFVLPLVALALLWVTTRRRQREAAARVVALAPGQRVITTSGLVGSLVSRDGGLARIEVAPGVVLTFDERALMGEAPSTTHPTGGPAGPTAPSKETD